MIIDERDYGMESDTLSPDWLVSDTEDWDIEPAESWELEAFRDELRLDGTLRPDTWH